MRYRPAGRFSDLIKIFARAEFAFTKDSLPVKSRLRRALLEPWFQLLGMFVATLTRVLPADISLRLLDKLYRVVENTPTPHPFPDSPGLGEAAELLRRVEKTTGRTAGLVCLMAHPPVDQKLLYLNIELFRHSLAGLRAVRGRPCRPRLVGAVDAYALDMMAVHEEGIYAGYLKTLHLGFDRMPLERPWPARLVVGGAAWTSITHRITAFLRSGGNMSMVPGGGVPITARVFYCARETVGRFCRRAPGASDPARVRARLLEKAPGFADFLASGAVGSGLEKSLWRLIEAWVIYNLTEGDAYREALAGVPSARGREAVAAAMEALGWPSDHIEAQLEAFAEEFLRETPYRERFFSYLVRRVAARGTPLVLFPFTFGSPDAVRLEFGSPFAIVGVKEGGRTIEVMETGQAPVDKDLFGFCRDFATAHYR